MPEIFPGEVFADTADFDTGIRQLLPRYDEMLDAIARCIPSRAQRILELGCGTGELSLKILQRCTDAQIIAIDYSPRMLEFAKQKITACGYQHRWTGIEADFGDWANHPETFAFGGEFDACVSSLAIHHLKDEMKFQLLQRIWENLAVGGCFWNADPILPESPQLAEVYKAAREEWAAEQGTTLTEVRDKLGNVTTQGHSRQDQLASLETQLKMLTTSGFYPVAVPWKYYGLAVFGGWIGSAES
jgi:trans-aconitate 2-methyltransferase